MSPVAQRHPRQDVRRPHARYAAPAASVRVWMRSSIASSATSSGRVSRWTWARQQAALQGREGGQGEVVGIHAGREVAASVHGPQPVADPGLPAAESAGHGHPRRVVDLGHLGAQGADRAAAAALKRALVLDQHVTPGPQAGHRVQVVEVGPLGLQDRVGLVVDDGADQRLLVLEVVVHLRAAHPGGRPDVLQRGLGRAALEDELRRGRDDPLPGLAPAAGQPSSRSCHDASTNWIGQPSFI